MWNFLNVVQVLVYLKHYALWSATMVFVFEQMDNAITLKPVIDPVYEIGQSKFDKVNSTVEDEGMKNSGIEETSVLKQLGLFTLVFAVIILGIGLYFVVRHLHKKGNKHIATLKDKIEKKLFFSGIYRYLVVSNLKLTVTIFGFLVAKWSFESFVTGATSVALLFGVFGLIVWPLFIMFTLERNFFKLEEDAFKKRHETIYQGIQTSSREALLYYSVFAMRRFYLVVINVVFSPREKGEKNEYLLKIIFFLIIQSIYILYVFAARPHTTRIFNRLEFFNEGMLIMLAYVMLIFCGLVPIEDLISNKASYVFAEWLGIGIAIFICIMNFYVMGKMTVDKIKAKMADKKQKKLDEVLRLKREAADALKERKFEAEVEKKVEYISLAARVDELIRTANEVKMEVVRPDDGVGVKVITNDRRTKVESTEFGYKIKTKDRNIKVIPNEYVRITAHNPALLISSARQKVFYDE